MKTAFAVCAGFLLMATLFVLTREAAFSSLVPMFVSPDGTVLRSCPPSLATLLRLPLMHLLFVGMTAWLASALPPVNGWRRLGVFGLGCATAKGILEILWLQKGLEIPHAAALIPVLVFLAAFLLHLARNRWQLPRGLRAPSTPAKLGLGLAGLFYAALVGMPFWMGC